MIFDPPNRVAPAQYGQRIATRTQIYNPLLPGVLGATWSNGHMSNTTSGWTDLIAKNGGL
jgi:hypothetical protein